MAGQHIRHFAPCAAFADHMADFALYYSSRQAHAAVGLDQPIIAAQILGGHKERLPHYPLLGVITPSSYVMIPQPIALAVSGIK